MKMTLQMRPRQQSALLKPDHNETVGKTPLLVDWPFTECGVSLAAGCGGCTLCQVSLLQVVLLGGWPAPVGQAQRCHPLQ